jgi:VRR-NUC domain
MGSHSGSVIWSACSGRSGRSLALEVKTPDGRVTEHQARFLERVRQHGGIAAVVRSVDDARAAITRAREETRNA